MASSCPYCVSDIAETALVCPVCRHDLQLVKSLLARIAELEAAPAAVPGSAPEADVPPPVVELQVPPEPAWGKAAGYLLATVLLLLLAHWLVVFLYDARLIWLRLLALALPLPFGFLFARAARSGFAVGLPAAMLMAGGAVLGMSAVTGWIDQTPVLPQNMAELRELIEFAASIALSFTTGLWLCGWLERREEARRHPVAVLAKGGQKVVSSLVRLNDVGSAVVAFATTAASIYTGLRSVVGS